MGITLEWGFEELNKALKPSGESVVMNGLAMVSIDEGQLPRESRWSEISERVIRSKFKYTMSQF